MRQFILIGILGGLALTTVVVSPVFSQEESDVASTSASGPLTVKMTDRMTFESDVSRMSGQVSVNQSNFTLEYEHKAFGELPLSFSLDYQYLDIDEDVPVNLPSQLHGLTFSAGAKFPMPFVDSDEYFMGVDVMPSMFTDDGSWESSAFRLPFQLYGIYKPNDTFTLVVGARIRPDYDTVVLPIIGFNYQPNERWDIRLASSEPTVTYHLSDTLSAFAEYAGSLDEYEVTRGSQAGVVFKLREATLGAGLKLRSKDWLEASVSAGASAFRRFSYRDNNGKVDADSAPYVKVRLSAKF